MIWLERNEVLGGKNQNNQLNINFISLVRKNIGKWKQSRVANVGLILDLKFGLIDGLSDQAKVVEKIELLEAMLK